MHPDLAFALDLADQAASIALPRFRAADLLVETKADLTPVTEVDRAVEEALRKRIENERPGESVVGEEFGENELTGGARWIIDPIDGTKNYLRGVPVWATLIGLERDGVVTVGVVSAPAMGRRWWAARGEGAFGDGERIRVSRIERLDQAHFLFGGLKAWRRAGMLQTFLELADRTWRTRGFGDFWMHMLVAEGAAEAAAEMEVSLWDLVAVQVIVEEAGGRFTDMTGRATPSGGSALSTNDLLHEEILGILQGQG